MTFIEYLYILDQMLTSVISAIKECHSSETDIKEIEQQLNYHIGDALIVSDKLVRAQNDLEIAKYNLSVSIGILKTFIEENSCEQN